MKPTWTPAKTWKFWMYFSQHIIAAVLMRLHYQIDELEAGPKSLDRLDLRRKDRIALAIIGRQLKSWILEGKKFEYFDYDYRSFMYECWPQTSEVVEVETVKE